MNRRVPQAFISYARVDNIPLPDGTQRFVSSLATNLKRCVDRRIGRSELASFFFDEDEIENNRPLSSQLREHAYSADVFVAVLSPAWLASTHCRQELEAFLGSGEGALDRLVAIELLPVDRPALPSALEDRPRIKFYLEQGLPGQKPKASTIGLPKVDETYYMKVESIGSDLAELLQRGRTRDSRAAAMAQSKGKVFLAEVTDDLEIRRQQVRDYLHQAGFVVVPDRTYPLARDQFESSARQDMDGCLAFIQLLSESPGKRPPDVPEGFPALQYHIAVEQRMDVLQWRYEHSRREVVESATAHIELLAQPTVAAEPLELFKKRIVDGLTIQISGRTRDAPVAPDNSERLVFINADQADRDLAQELRLKLAASNCFIAVNHFEGEAAELRRHLRTYFRECSLLILLYGSAAPTWVSRQLALYRKSRIGSRAEFIGGFVVNAPPLPKADIGADAPRFRHVPVDGAAEAVKNILRLVGCP